MSILLDWKSWMVISLLVAAAVGQAFNYVRRQEAGRRASDAGNIFILHQDKGYVFFPAGLSHYRSLYIGEEGIIIETESDDQKLSWSEISHVVRFSNYSAKALRETYKLLFYWKSSSEEPLILHLGSFRREEIKLMLKLIRKRVRLVER